MLIIQAPQSPIILAHLNRIYKMVVAVYGNAIGQFVNNAGYDLTGIVVFAINWRQIYLHWHFKFVVSIAARNLKTSTPQKIKHFQLAKVKKKKKIK